MKKSNKETSISIAYALLSMALAMLAVGTVLHRKGYLNIDCCDQHHHAKIMSK